MVLPALEQCYYFRFGFHKNELCDDDKSQASANYSPSGDAGSLGRVIEIIESNRSIYRCHCWPNVGRKIQRKSLPFGISRSRAGFLVLPIGGSGDRVKNMRIAFRCHSNRKMCINTALSRFPSVFFVFLERNLLPKLLQIESVIFFSVSSAPR